MDTKEAKEILDSQISKLSKLTKEMTSAYLSQTRSYIDHIFGETSHESQFMHDFSFYEYNSRGDSEINIKAKGPVISNFLHSCKEVVGVKGVYKPPKTNFLFRLDYRWIIGGALTAALTIAGVAYTLGKKDADFNLRDENRDLKDSLSRLTIGPTLNVPEKKSDKDTSGNEQDIRPDTVHLPKVR